MVRNLKLAAAGLVMTMASSAALAGDALTSAQLQKLFPGTFTAVVHGGVTLTFTAKGNGVLIGQMPGKQDEGRWSLENGKLCIMLSTWTKGRPACSAVVAGDGWYRGQGVKFRKI
jgi:hypothetical protein